ncbi:unnamed protein product [Euphydryas editha]|uniref:Uncharacterized protein n=1 Tax=Euphydryas editha TaxID=104508 RepID=A0AAU9U8D5_EUPED|nr:unnamed protein product [Euphydryas editha]
MIGDLVEINPPCIDFSQILQFVYLLLMDTGTECDDMWTSFEDPSTQDITRKTEIMVLKAGNKKLYKATLKRNIQFNYLCHWVTEDLSDNMDIEK